MTLLTTALVSLFELAGAQYDIDWRVLASIGYIESRFEPWHISGCGAVGLLGLVPLPGQTIEWLLNPANNADEGARRLRESLGQVGGDLRRAFVVHYMGLTGAQTAGWERSQDGRAYLDAFATSWELLFSGQPLPWPVVGLRGEELCREP